MKEQIVIIHVVDDLYRLFYTDKYGYYHLHDAEVALMLNMSVFEYTNILEDYNGKFYTQYNHICLNKEDAIQVKDKLDSIILIKNMAI